MLERLRYFLLKNSPEWLLQKARNVNKSLRRKELRRQEISGGVTHENLVSDFINIGIRKGDSLLVHSSLSKIGFVEGGAATLISALLNVIGEDGTLLMPAFPASGRNRDYLEEHRVFNVIETPSAMGVVTETFRKMPGVLRSLHPTDSVCAFGPLAGYYTSTHFGQMTPYNEHSPFRKLALKHGKILMLGTTLNGACTSLHTLEDAVSFRYPVYDEKVYDVNIIDGDGKQSLMKTRVHNPEYSAKRNCDALKPIFEKEGVLVNGRIGQAECMLIDAAKMLEIMIRYYNDYGVTMYTPYGDKNQLR